MSEAQRESPGPIPDVLVAYATRAGSTRELAEEVIAPALREQGMKVGVQAASQVMTLAPYTAVVLGSALYFQRLMPDAIAFLKTHMVELASRPTALFTVGAEMRKGPSRRRVVDGWVQKSLAGAPAIRFVALEHFPGAVELDRLTFSWRLLVRLTRGELGDWRQPESVREWATTIVPLLGQD